MEIIIVIGCINLLLWPLVSCNMGTGVRLEAVQGCQF